MNSSPLPRPTDAELAILRVLWKRGKSTVREVQEQLERARPTGYTTVLKLLQIMTEKQLVLRDTRERSHRYEAALPEGETQQQLLHDLTHRAFGGSTKGVFLHLLETADIDEGELAELRKLIDSKIKEDNHDPI